MNDDQYTDKLGTINSISKPVSSQPQWFVGFPSESGLNISSVKVISSRAGTLESQVTESAYSTCHTLGSSHGENLFSPEMESSPTKREQS